MAKRFTDSDKWNHSWFRKLKPKYKCAWIYLLDRCDHAGIWIEDLEAMEFNIGESISIKELLMMFGDKIRKIDSDKYLIQSFIDFQYGNLNPDNKVHNSIIKKLGKYHGASTPLERPLDGAKDKEKDMDKEKDLDKELEKAEEKEKEKEKEKEENVALAPKKELHPIVVLFNNLSYKHQMPIVKVFSKSRKALLAKAIAEVGDNHETWTNIFLVAGKKGFVGNGGKVWTPSFDYIFRNSNYVKFSEEDPNLKTSSTLADYATNQIINNPYN